MAKRPDICSFGAIDAHSDSGKIHIFYLQAVDLHRSCFSLHFFPLAGQLVEFPAVYLQRGIHRRNLFIMADKAQDGFPHLFFIQAGRIPLLEDRTCGILRICFYSQ